MGMESRGKADWEIKPLKELVTYKKGKKPAVLSDQPFDGGIPYLDIKAIEQGITDRYAAISSSNIIEDGSLLVVWDGARSGWVGKSKQGAIGSTLMALTPKNVDHTYLYHFLKTQFDTINSNPKGTGIPHVDPYIFWNIEVPIAPPEEQKKIAEFLTEVTQKVDNCRSRLDRIPLLLKRFRQSVLAAAVSGELTRGWREENGIDLIKKWQVLKAHEACKVVACGSTPKGKPFTNTGDIPFLKVYNIVDQQINFYYKPQFISKDIHTKELKRSTSYPGDVIMNIVGPPLGKVATIPRDFPEWNMNQALVIFRASEKMLPRFLYFVLCEGEAVRGIDKEFRGTAGQSNISLTQCRNFVFPAPPIEEQKKIIEIVDELFSVADKIESRYNNLKKYTDSLPQAILRGVFGGYSQ